MYASWTRGCVYVYAGARATLAGASRSISESRLYDSTLRIRVYRVIHLLHHLSCASSANNYLIIIQSRYPFCPLVRDLRALFQRAALLQIFVHWIEINAAYTVRRKVDRKLRVNSWNDPRLDESRSLEWRNSWKSFGKIRNLSHRFDVRGIIADRCTTFI